MNGASECAAPAPICVALRTTAAVVAMFVLTAITSGGASAAEIYVPDEHPTIQAAVDAAVDHDEIIVRPGVYQENLDLQGKNITLRSERGPDMTIIDGGRRGNVVVNPGRYGWTRFAGFTVRNGFTEFEHGAGLWARISDMTIENCRFENNETVFGIGGGVYIGGGSVRILNCVFAGNHSGTYGGGLGVVDTTGALIRGCTLIGNSSIHGGGIKESINDGLMVVNCLIANNSAPDGGGGVYHTDSACEVVNCTIVGNTRHAVSAHAGTPKAEIYYWNCVIANSDVSILGEPHIAYSFVEGGYDGEGNIDVDPDFVDAASGDYRLRFDSPCIDAGDNEAFPSDVSIDIAGRPRFADDPLTIDTGRGQAPLIDIGAYEYEPTSSLLRVKPMPVIGGERVTATVFDGAPDAHVWLLYSTRGAGAFYVQQLNITVDLANPALVGQPLMTDGLGGAQWEFIAPNLREPRPIWIQAMQRESKSNHVATEIQ